MTHALIKYYIYYIRAIHLFVLTAIVVGNKGETLLLMQVTMGEIGIEQYNTMIPPITYSALLTVKLCTHLINILNSGFTVTCAL